MLFNYFNYFNISLFIGGLVALVAGLLPYISEKTETNKQWLLLNVAVSVWSFGYFSMITTSEKEIAWISQIFMHFAATLIPVLYLHFTLEITEKAKKYKGGLRMIYILTALLFILVPFKLYIRDVVPKFIFKYVVDAGPLYIFFTIYFWLVVIYAAAILFKTCFERTGGERTRLLYIFFSQIGFLGGGSVFFLTFNISIPPYLLSLFAIYPILITYAITKHQLFDIRAVVAEFFTFAIWLVLLVKTLLSENIHDFILNISILFVVVVFGVLLIKSVLKEVRQREEMEKLSKDLESAYGSEREARERIERAKVEDEALLGSIGDGVVAIDKNGEVMFVNRAAEQMLGFDGESGGSDLIGKPYEQILQAQNEKGEVLDDGKNPIHQALNSGKKIITDATGTPEKTIYFMRSDKTKFPAAVTVTPVVLQGKIIGVVNVFRDVTIERQIDKSKTEFVSLASHQLRTPLTAIKWYAEMLQNPKKAGKLTKKQKEYLDVIYQGNMRMINLVDIMLNVSRLDAGKVKIVNEPTDIKKIAEIIIKEEEVNIKKRKQKLVFDCKEEKATTVTDPNQIRIVFQNIISNAIKYTPEKGKVVCSLQKQNNEFLFSVKDSGIGIPKAHQKRIFEKLFRADNASSYQPDGNGLGLYAAKAIIENLGGRIWFESVEGEGTTFYVTLPLRENRDTIN